MQYLDKLTEDEFGGGTELSSTGFIVFGLLTFWIYTVHVYQGILRRHVDMRLAYFKSLLKQNSPSVPVKEMPEEIVQKGFRLNGNPTKICIVLYASCMFIILTKVLQSGGLGFLEAETIFQRLNLFR